MHKLRVIEKRSEIYYSMLEIFEDFFNCKNLAEISIIIKQAIINLTQIHKYKIKKPKFQTKFYRIIKFSKNDLYNIL